MFGKRRRRKGLGLTGILIIGALLYFTGAGAWLWDRTKQLEGQCYNLVAQSGVQQLTAGCSGLGKAITGADGAFTSIGDTLRSTKESLLGSFGSGPGGLGDINLSSALEKLGSSSDQLKAMLSTGPQGFGSGAPASERLRNALDNFNIGQQYLQGGGGSANQALPWLQQGANNPGYGVLSQLSLGDMYSKGFGNVAANPALASHYYGQANQSIGLLQQSNSPEAQRLLQSLPADPQQVKQQIQQAMGQLQRIGK